MDPMSIGIIVGIFLVSIVPFHFAVLLLGGETSFFKTLFTVIGVGIVSTVLQIFIPFGGIIAFIIGLFIYSNAFEMNVFKVLIAYLIEIAVIVGLYYLVFVVLGYTAPVLF